MKTEVYQLVWSVFLFSIVILGAVLSVGWAENLLAFLAWALPLVFTLALLGIQDRESLERHARPPMHPAVRWFDRAQDYTSVGILAATGHFLFAGLWLYHVTVAMTVYSELIEAYNQKTKEENSHE